MSAHPDDATLLALLEGSLDEATISEVDAHLDECDECREVVGLLASGTRTKVTAPLTTGDRLGRYVAREKIGEGASGAVYAAHDPELEREVALKILHAETDAKSRARLVREAQAMAQLSHPHVVTVHDVGARGDDVWLAMELAPGGTLREWMATEPSTESVLRFFFEAGAGLAAAHAAGIVHRDFKPENVLLAEDGSAKVADFGLAREPMGDAPPAGERIDALTRTGALLGTPAYMAPEQLAGEQATASSDQFAFAVALWEALEGERPFRAETLGMLRTMIANGPPPMKRGPKHVERALRRAMRSDPEARFGSVLELLAALAPPKRRWLWAAAPLGLLTLGALGFVFSQDPCAEVGAAVDETWNDGAREEVVRALASQPGVAFAAAVDRWAEGWAREREACCRETHVEHAQSEAKLDARMACFEGQAREVRALLARMKEPAAAAFALEAAEALPNPGRCDGSGEPVTPLEPERAERLSEELAAARALLTTGSREALAAAEAVAEEADSLGHAPLVVAAQRLVSDAYRHAARFDAAESAARASLFAAEETGDAQGIAEAWLAVVRSAGEAGRYERAARYVEHAAAAVARTEVTTLREELAHVRGVLHTHLGAFEEASRGLRDALEMRRERLGEDAPSLAALHTSLGNLARLSGDLEGALEEHERALRLDQALGEAHPRVGRDLHNVAGILRRMARTEEARERYARALRIKTETLGEEHPEVGLTKNSLGLLAFDAGEHDTARRLWREALATFEARGHADAAMVHHNLALVAMRLGDAEGARRHAAAAIRLDEERRGPESKPVASELVTLARALVALGRTQDARRRLDRASDLAEVLGDAILREEVAETRAAADARDREAGDGANAQDTEANPRAAGAQDPEDNARGRVQDADARAGDAQNPEAEAHGVPHDARATDTQDTEAGSRAAELPSRGDPTSPTRRTPTSAERSRARMRGPRSTERPTEEEPTAIRPGGSGVYGAGRAWD